MASVYRRTWSGKDGVIRQRWVAAYKGRGMEWFGGEVAPTRCGHAFFGSRHCLFATDAPFDPERGRALIADTLAGSAAPGHCRQSPCESSQAARSVRPVL